jgi:hypothetical protein
VQPPPCYYSNLLEKYAVKCMHFSLKLAWGAALGFKALRYLLEIFF